MIRRALLLSAFTALPVACGTRSPANDIGEARAEITQVPADVRCVQVIIVGADHAVTRQFDVTPGASSVLALKELPLGSDTFKGSAFAEACSSVTGSSTPTWTGDDVTTTLSPGVITEVKLVLVRGGQASVSVDFQDAGGGSSGAGGTGGAGGGGSGGGPTCPFGTTLCFGSCVDTGRDPHNCGGCGHVCAASDSCGGSGVPGVCGCTDDGNACSNKICGNVINNCGQTVSCGTCGGTRPTCCTESCVCSTCECP